MHPTVVRKLLAINHQFYQTFAQEFAATRRRLQPGVLRLLERLPREARILDLGCGNGELARELARRGFRGRYLGLDFSEELLRVASNIQHPVPHIEYRTADLSAPDWDAGLGPGSFDVALAFAVLHHLPPPLYPQILRKTRALLTACSRPSAPYSLLLSNWQFLNSPRWRARLQPWEKVGLTANDVGPDDYLLDWRRGGTGYRYVHHFNEKELNKLAADTGFEVVETFYSDGKEGNLACYQVWRLA